MRKFNVKVNGTTYEVEIEEAGSSAPSAAPVQENKAPAPAAVAKEVPAGGTKVTSPMPGNILKVNFAEGDAVKKGDILCILEAMKMENEILAPVDGKLSAVCVKKGDSVTSGALLFTIE